MHGNLETYTQYINIIVLIIPLSQAQNNLNENNFKKIVVII